MKDYRVMVVKYGYAVVEAESEEEALEKAKKRAKKEEAVLVFGSLSYLGEVIRLENVL